MGRGQGEPEREKGMEGGGRGEGPPFESKMPPLGRRKWAFPRAPAKEGFLSNLSEIVPFWGLPFMGI